ncbi:hypothetical protein K0M31_001803 [Melipona bicolor]|uniref:Uncharacterized protein n=1 Tax=Melipona bicolor TaxID=60889 RepID=A0AA40GHD8_9HYME|nr:hypothetical protein K0M31_001803 [Melipona bicolor]
MKSEPFIDSKGNKEERNGKKRGRPLGKNKRQKEVPKQSRKKLEDFVDIFSKKDRVKRPPVNNKEGSFKTGKSVKIRSKGKRKMSR